jgi:hypothetical protein
MLGSLPGDWLATKEEDDATGALASVDVPNHVDVVVPDQVLPTFLTPGLVDSKVSQTCHVLEDMIDSGEVNLTWRLHEPAEVPDQECKVRPSMQPISECSNDARVVLGVHILSCAPFPQLEPALNG